MLFENRNYAFAGAFVDELARCGLKHVCICPGSRSTPLAISFARNQCIRKWVHLDERSASFFALGIAKYLREPVAILCSSGTATANFFPAIVEAHNSLVPLIVLTADRPAELVDWGALQTIDQTRMYGSHAKWSVNMPAPESSPAMLAYVRQTVGRAMSMSQEGAAGPVHINFPFRDPLEPAEVLADSPDRAQAEHQGYCGRKEEAAFLCVKPPVIQPDRQAILGLASELICAGRGIIVCGPETGDDVSGCVGELARKLGYPVLADCLSQVRCGANDRSLVIDQYDSFIRNTEAVQALAPEVVIRFGALPVSKPLWQYLERHQSARHILVDPGTAWRDPLHVTGELWRSDPALFCNMLASALPEQKNGSGQWQSTWQKLNNATGKAIRAELDADKGLFEGKVYSELSQLLPDNSLLFVGNSMPVRDLDTFSPCSDKSIRFMANRGASGIDGVVSSALGAAAVASGKTVLVLGDISFYHDMNGLLAARSFGLNATIIVINNNGGGIFSFLPQAAYEDVFEPYFGTPHGLTFKAAADLYGLKYELVHDWKEFNAAVTRSLGASGTTIVEVPGDRKLNLSLHRKVQKAVTESVRQAIKP